MGCFRWRLGEGPLRTIRGGLVGAGRLAGRILSVAMPWPRWVLCSCLTFHKVSLVSCLGRLDGRTVLAGLFLGPSRDLSRPRRPENSRLSFQEVIQVYVSVAVQEAVSKALQEMVSQLVSETVSDSDSTTSFKGSDFRKRFLEVDSEKWFSMPVSIPWFLYGWFFMSLLVF